MANFSYIVNVTEEAFETFFILSEEKFYGGEIFESENQYYYVDEVENESLDSACGIIKAYRADFKKVISSSHVGIKILEPEEE